MPTVQETARAIAEVWPKLLLTDRRRFEPERRRLSEALRRDVPETREALTARLAGFLGRLENAAAHSYEKSAARLKIEFPPELPITSHIPTIREALKSSQVVIVCGSTGSGKTTQLPKAALLEHFGRTGRIGCTQPRRIAASSLAHRLADELGAVCGQEVGYQVRFDNRAGDTTSVKFMTDGILLSETCNDRDLLQYDCLILDEVHERSLNIDFLLGYVKLLLKRRKDLRVIISSATLAAERLAEFFGGVPVIEVEGRVYPVEDVFQEAFEDEELPETVRRAAQFLHELDPAGDILVFLPGEREIRECAAFLAEKSFRNTEVLPLFGRLGAAEQAKIFQPGRLTRIILATNVAETSLTIPRIRYVIDSGLVRLSRFNPRSGIQKLQIEAVSRASADQRRGRCGRLKDGICVHLYSQSACDGLEKYTDPEIQRSSLAGVILKMAELRLPPIEVFPFLDPPAPTLIREGIRTLADLEAVDGRGQLTRLGHRLAAMPIDPPMGRILLAAEKYGVLKQMLVIVAFLSLQDPRERPSEQAKAADDAHRKFDSETSDFLGILLLWNAAAAELKISRSALRRFAKKEFLNYRRLTEWCNLIRDLAELFRIQDDPVDWTTDSGEDADAIHKSLLTGLARKLSLYDPEKKLYCDRAGKTSVIFPGSGLAKRKKTPLWLLPFAMVETTKVFARCNAEVNPEWLEECAPHLCTKTYDNVSWNEQSGFVTAREKVMAGNLLIHAGRRCHYAPIAPAEAREVFLREALVPGKVKLPSCPWLKKCDDFLLMVRNLEIRMRRPDSLLNPDALYDHFDRVIPPDVCSTESLKRFAARTHADFAPKPDDVLYFPLRELHPEDYPDFLEFGGCRFRLSYCCDPEDARDGVTLYASETELPLLPRHAPEYLTPGLLKRKVELLLRALPKSTRRLLLPMDDCIELFLASEPDMDYPLAASLTAFLEQEYQVETPEEVFDNLPVPEYLQMKIAVRGSDGSVLAVRRDLPGTGGNAIRRSSAPAKGGAFRVEPSKTWPDGLSLPLRAPLSPHSAAIGYPALCCVDPDKVAADVFRTEEEARINHEAALFRLFRNEYPMLFRQLRKDLIIPHEMETAVFARQTDWKNALIDQSIRDSVESGGLFSVRSAQEFDAFADTSRQSLADLLDARLALLDDLWTAAEKVKILLKKVDADIKDDARFQLETLFRPGFLKNAAALNRYPVYLKALALRLERAAMSGAKDRTKGAALAPVVQKFRTAAEKQNFDFSPLLEEFFPLLEEARLAAYTPEIPARKKTPPEALKKELSRIVG